MVKTTVWICVGTRPCADCAGTGWQDMRRGLVCVSCMGWGYNTIYEGRTVTTAEARATEAAT